MDVLCMYEAVFLSEPWAWNKRGEEMCICIVALGYLYGSFYYYSVCLVLVEEHFVLTCISFKKKKKKSGEGNIVVTINC